MILNPRTLHYYTLNGSVTGTCNLVAAINAFQLCYGLLSMHYYTLPFILYITSFLSSSNNLSAYILQDFKNEKHLAEAVECLNEMVTNALSHVEDCLKYMSALREPFVFRFCAIPQVRSDFKISPELLIWFFKLIEDVYF